ncbi:MAG TPA: amidase family protein, partial [Burkholderiales bacterium]|nr:amidase family protein [Burkholderiales bacterium]
AECELMMGRSIRSGMEQQITCNGDTAVCDASRELYVQRALEMIGNTAPFDITHHPAMTLPCGMVDGLPIGLMLIGRHFDESTIYRAAYAFEQAGDWKSM